MRDVILTKPAVELYKILKFEGLISSGGEAKAAIDAGLVKVNGEVETRRRRQINAGDIIELGSKKLQMRLL
jgi:ribosome-associated protein